jgi:hypothetical protein
MAIVRQDRRASAIDGFKEARSGAYESLRSIDGTLAALDDTELALGLATEGEQGQREQYIVMHFLKGDATGHTLDECDGKGCASQAADDVLAGLESDTEDDTTSDGEGEGEDSEDDETPA